MTFLPEGVSWRARSSGCANCVAAASSSPALGEVKTRGVNASVEPVLRETLPDSTNSIVLNCAVGRDSALKSGGVRLSQTGNRETLPSWVWTWVAESLSPTTFCGL